MPGTYAHITLVNELKETHRLEALPRFTPEAISAVLDYVKYCELGATSPDYPYLAIGNREAAAWADAMHYTRAGEMIHAGILSVRTLSGEARRKCFSWLLGYAAHVATDVTIHPVVNLKVGPYEQNKRQHRICEMNQDVYIFQRLNLGPLGMAEHLDHGVCACGTEDELDRDICHTWEIMLREIHPAQYASSRPDYDLWHRRFRQTVDGMAEEGYRLWPLARHVAAGIAGLFYPTLQELDIQYVRQLAVPGGRTMDYDQIFDFARDNVGRVWSLIAAGVNGDEAFRTEIGNWNLDTGMDEQGQLVFWR